MKLMKLLGLGLLIWGLTLLWPEVNQFLSAWLVTGMTLGLGAVLLTYLLVQRVEHHHHNDDTGQNHPTHPMPAVARH
jgi:hypothetical protein